MATKRIYYKRHGLLKRTNFFSLRKGASETRLSEIYGFPRTKISNPNLSMALESIWALAS